MPNFNTYFRYVLITHRSNYEKENVTIMFAHMTGSYQKYIQEMS